MRGRGKGSDVSVFALEEKSVGTVMIESILGI